MSKQDRQGARTPAELERKYEFGQTLSQLEETSKQNSERISKQGQEMEKFISSSYGKFSSMEKDLNSADKVISVLTVGMSNLQTRMTNAENRYKELVKVADVSGMISTLNGISENLAVLNNRIGDMENVVYSAHGTVKEASGSVLYLDDTPECKLSGLVLYGRTTQDGTPTPDAPVPLNSAGGEGNIAVTVGERKAVFATPNGLPGIPVSADGNYTDESGQQWVCDEIDFARGKYVKRVGRTTINGTEGWNQHGGATSEKVGYYAFVNMGQKAYGDGTHGVFSHFVTGLDALNVAFVGSNTIQWRMSPQIASTVDELKSWLASNNVDVMFALAEPIETDLTAEQLAQYATLRTSYPSTSIYNSAGAGMLVTYTSRELT